MRRIIMLVTLAGRRLAADGVPLIGPRHARRLLVLSATLTAVMLVGLLGYATSSRADMTCSTSICVEKTASADPVMVDETLTFTIRGFCAPGNTCLLLNNLGIRDTLPAGLEFVSATATGLGDPTCSQSAGTVMCAPFSFNTGQK